MTRHRIYPADHLATATQAELLAWMAAERVDLLAQLNGLTERILCEQPSQMARLSRLRARDADRGLAGRSTAGADTAKRVLREREELWLKTR